MNTVTVEENSALFRQILRQHESALDLLGRKIRAEIVQPVCKKHKLIFVSGNGTFFFRRRTKNNNFDAVELTYGNRVDLNQAVPHGYRDLSVSAKERLGPILDLLNEEISHGQYLGYLIDDVK